MLFHWLRSFLHSRPVTAPRQRSTPLGLEVLEARAVPALAVTTYPLAQIPSTLALSLGGPGVKITSPKFTGAAASAGTFTGGAVFGFSSGIILDTGLAKGVAPGGGSTSTDNKKPGDSALDQIVTPESTFDASILEFNFVPKTSILSFKYVFASTEYNQFVGGPFSDVFAFYLNGKNVALTPGTKDPVTINTINKGSNANLFIDNDPADFGGTRPHPTQMNGYTVVLTITTNVNPGVNNHIKLAIADTFDSIFDSSVFIAAGSFRSQVNPVVYNPLRYTYNASTHTYDGYLTVINIGTAPLTVSAAVVVPNLPNGVTVVGATKNFAGFVGYNVLPVRINSLLPNQSIKIPVKFNNPYHVALPNYFGPSVFRVRVTEA